MLAENLGGELSEFDLKHFCDGNPVYCYYFRVPQAQPAARLRRALVEPEAIPSEILLLRRLQLDSQAKTDKPLKL